MVISITSYEEYKIFIKTNSTDIDKEERITYDLHVGMSYRRPGDTRKYEFPNKFVLKPNTSILIDTEEDFVVPNTVFGQLVSRASLSAEGLVVANLKIDPKFQGKLVVSVFNTSKNRITLQKGMRFCSIYFQLLQNAVPGSIARTPPGPKIITGKKYLNAFYNYLPYIITFLASLTAALLKDSVIELVTNLFK